MQILTKKLQPAAGAGRDAALHQVYIIAAGSQAEIPPAMFAVERKCPRVCGADAQLCGLNSMPAHEIHCVVLKLPADARASHLLDQVKEVHVPASWLLEDLHLHLPDDLVGMPGVNIPI